MLVEEALEKELAFKKLEDTLKCNPTDQFIYSSKIQTLTTELTQHNATSLDLKEKVSKLVDENKELKEIDREMKLRVELAVNG